MENCKVLQWWGPFTSKSEYSGINKTWVDNKEKYYRVIASQKIARHTVSQIRNAEEKIIYTEKGIWELQHIWKRTEVKFYCQS